MIIANIKNSKHCAFCKYWYDPTYSAINPSSPKAYLWEYDSRVSKICLKRGCQMKASGTCPQYVCKIEY